MNSHRQLVQRRADEAALRLERRRLSAEFGRLKASSLDAEHINNIFGANDMDQNQNDLGAQVRRVLGDFQSFTTASKERMGEVQARLLDVEQKLARRGAPDSGSFSDAGGAVLRAAIEENMADLEAVASGKSRRCSMPLPQAAITSAGHVMPDQRPNIVAPAQRRLRTRGLLPSVPTNSGSVQFLQETGFTNAAETVSESTQKPESTLTFELKTAPVVTLAHFFKASVQILSDVAQMQQYIANRGLFGLADTEDLQLLRGSGIGNNLSGMLTFATAFTGSGTTKIDILRSAIEQLELQDFAASGIVLHPSEWSSIQRIKNSVGDYIVGTPDGVSPPSLWGIPVIATRSMTSQGFLVGDFAQAGLIFDREQARVDVSTEDDQNFTKNLVTIRVESRLAFANLRAAALVKGTFGS